MTTLTGMLAATMTAIQMRKKLLRTVFALQVSTVGERGFRSFTSHREVETFFVLNRVAVGYYRMFQSIRHKTLKNCLH